MSTEDFPEAGAEAAALPAAVLAPAAVPAAAAPQTPHAETAQASSPGRRFSIGRTLLLLVAVGAAGFGIAHWLRRLDPLRIDRRAALVEVLPSESLQASPAASDLVNRLINKHVLLLHDRALLVQVLQNPDTTRHERWMTDKNKDTVEALLSAVHVWAIPNTNVIALTVDAASATDSTGNDSAMLAEAIVNQYLENQKIVNQNKQLERSVVLNNLKQRYQFRREELQRDLREKTARLSIDGMGQPGRLSPKEVELADLLYLRGEVERKMLDATDPEAKAALKGQMKNASERIDAMEADLGDLTNAMNQYQTMRDDEQATRERLDRINDELEVIQQSGIESPQEIRWVRHPER